ncbi:MAG TPA: hypothetical protein VIC08_04070, partial [Cellvibrionaceae bacterium]
MKLPSRHAHCFALCTLLTLTACSDSGNNSSANEPTLNKTGMCLDKARENPCALFSENTVRSALDSLPAEIKTDESVSQRSASCTYSWSGGRKKQMSSDIMSIAYDVNDSLALSGIEQMTLNRFTMQHRNMSEEEKAAAAKRVEEAMQKRVDDGTLGKEHQNMGNDFASSMINNIQWQAFDGLGEAAAWGGVGRHKSLSVFSGGVKFSVLADISDNDDENRDASVKLAE